MPLEPPENSLESSVTVETIAKDDTVVVFEKSEWSQSIVLTDLVTSFPFEDVREVPIPTSGKILELIKEFTRMHKGEKVPKNLLPREAQIPESVHRFLMNHSESMMDILEASDYMGITRLYSYACKEVAGVINGTPKLELGIIFKFPLDVPKLPEENVVEDRQNNANPEEEVQTIEIQRATNQSKFQYVNPFILIAFILSYFYGLVEKGYGIIQHFCQIWNMTKLYFFKFSKFLKLMHMRAFIKHELVLNLQLLPLNRFVDVLRYVDNGKKIQLAMVDVRWEKMLKEFGVDLPSFEGNYHKTRTLAFGEIFDVFFFLKQSNPQRFYKDLWFKITINRKLKISVLLGAEQISLTVFVEKIPNGEQRTTTTIGLGGRKFAAIQENGYIFRVFSQKPIEDLSMIAEEIQKLIAPNSITVDFNGSEEDPLFMEHFIPFVDWMDEVNIELDWIYMNIELASSQQLASRIDSITRKRYLRVHGVLRDAFRANFNPKCRFLDCRLTMDDITPNKHLPIEYYEGGDMTNRTFVAYLKKWLGQSPQKLANNRLIMVFSEPVDLKLIQMSVEKHSRECVMHRNRSLLYLSSLDERNIGIWELPSELVVIEQFPRYLIEIERKAQKAGRSL